MLILLHFLTQELETIAQFIFICGILGILPRKLLVRFIPLSIGTSILVSIGEFYFKDIAIFLLIGLYMEFLIIFRNINTLNNLTCIFMFTYVITSIIEGLISVIFPFVITSNYSSYIQLLLLILICICYYILCTTNKFTIIGKLINKWPFAAKLLFSYSFFSVVILILLFRINIQNFFELSIGILIILAGIFIINLEFFSSRAKQTQLAEQLECYEQYMPIVDNLISEIQATEHDYKNRIHSMNLLSMSCDDIETLRNELNVNFTKQLKDEDVYRLLKLNYHLLSGLLIAKYREAQNLGINLFFDIKTFFISTVVPEYRIIDMCGIVIDNALENTPREYPVFVSIDSTNNKFIFDIRNYGYNLGSNEILRLFKKGYTTKNTKGHGMGLYNLREAVSSYDGNINVYNETLNNHVYICFTIEV